MILTFCYAVNLVMLQMRSIYGCSLPLKKDPQRRPEVTIFGRYQVVMSPIPVLYRQELLCQPWWLLFVLFGLLCIPILRQLRVQSKRILRIFCSIIFVFYMLTFFWGVRCLYNPAIANG